MFYAKETPLERIISDSAKAIEDFNSSKRPVQKKDGSSEVRLIVFVSNNCQRSGFAREVANQFPNHEIYNIDEDDGREMAYKWGVLTIPTLMLVDAKGRTMIRKWPGQVPRPNDIVNFLP
ncbi:MAG: thioredoxin family protein [Candidatus Pacebacteria bacterium]|jgi:protein-disulfide isomerase-like protein with CxxC motif|nr:thioredoxin family protein [Candidatus Paceibacterota bacterium]